MRPVALWAVVGAVGLALGPPQEAAVGPIQSDPVVDAARRWALRYSQTLPDFVCTEFIHRYQNWTGTDFQFDTLTFRVSFYRQREAYELVARNSKPSYQRVESLNGSITRGEFGSALRLVFDAGSAAAFEPQRPKRIERRPAAAYGYAVRLENFALRVGIRQPPDPQCLPRLGICRSLYRPSAAADNGGRSAAGFPHPGSGHDHRLRFPRDRRGAVSAARYVPRCACSSCRAKRCSSISAEMTRPPPAAASATATPWSFEVPASSRQIRSSRFIDTGSSLDAGLSGNAGFLPFSGSGVFFGPVSRRRAALNGTKHVRCAPPIPRCCVCECHGCTSVSCAQVVHAQRNATRYAFHSLCTG